MFQTHTHTHTLAIAHDLQVPKARKARSVDVLFVLDATASMRWGKGTWHCIWWCKRAWQHDVEGGQGTACGGEGTRHCMWWRGDMALHVVERGQGTA